MPPYVPVPNTVQVDLKFVLGAAQAQNSYYFKKASAWTPAEMDTLMNTVEAWWIDAADSIMTIEAKLYGIRAVDLTSLDTMIRTKTVDHPGGLPFPAAPVNSTLAIKFDTGKRGRGRSGRIFYPFPAEDAIDAYTVGASQLEGILGGFEDLITAVPGAISGAQWVVVHRIRDGLPLNPGTTDPVLGVAVSDPTLDSMKNRLPNHRRAKRPAP